MVFLERKSDSMGVTKGDIVYSPTIRITTKCTQSCSHCCFECSPNRNDMMNIDVAKSISDFIKKNNIDVINVMGGEFFCNSDWKDIIRILSDNVVVRLVTNSDWIVLKHEVIDFLLEYKNVYMALSKTKFHTNANVQNAIDTLDKYGIAYILDKHNINNNVVPVGRGINHFGFYHMLGAYCMNPKHCMSFLIDEVGDLYKCPFGLWKIGNVFDNNVLHDLELFNDKFNSAHIMTCSQCVRIHKDIKW